MQFICEELQHHIYFLRRLRSSEAIGQIISLFFQSVIHAVLHCRAWLSSLSVKLELEAKLYRQIQLVQRLLANLWRTHFQATHDKSALALANSISPSVS